VDRALRRAMLNVCAEGALSLASSKRLLDPTLADESVRSL